jgi:hypothetical protein
MKSAVSLTLNSAGGVLEEGHAFGLSQIGQVNEDANLASERGLKNGVQESTEIELRELAAIGGRLDGGHGGEDSTGNLSFG